MNKNDAIKSKDTDGLESTVSLSMDDIESNGLDPFPGDTDIKSSDGTTIPDAASEETTTTIERDDLDRCHWGELIFALVAGFVFIGLQHVPGNSLVYFLAVLCTLTGVYVLYKIRKHGLRPVADDWGLTLEHFCRSLLWCTLAGIVGVLVMSIWIVRGLALPYNHHLAICLALYPLWGCAQQFLVQGMIGLNLSKVPCLAKSPALVCFLTACSFSIVHYGSWELMMATFFMGLCFTPVYLKHRCIYPLGLYHGWLGALFYWWVLGRDPLRNL
jgi:hypothetical protein